MISEDSIIRFCGACKTQSPDEQCTHARDDLYFCDTCLDKAKKDIVLVLQALHDAQERSDDYRLKAKFWKHNWESLGAYADTLQNKLAEAILDFNHSRMDKGIDK